MAWSGVGGEEGESLPLDSIAATMDSRKNWIWSPLSAVVHPGNMAQRASGRVPTRTACLAVDRDGLHRGLTR